MLSFWTAGPNLPEACKRKAEKMRPQNEAFPCSSVLLRSCDRTGPARTHALDCLRYVNDKSSPPTICSEYRKTTPLCGPCMRNAFPKADTFSPKHFSNKGEILPNPTLFTLSGPAAAEERSPPLAAPLPPRRRESVPGSLGFFFCLLFRALGLRDVQVLGFRVSVRWSPHPVIVSIRDNRDYIGVLLLSYSITITGWGVLLRYRL